MLSAEKNKTVLIAEDEEDLREMYKQALSKEGFTVLEARNGREALAILKDNCQKVGVMSLDIVMPEMDGFETLEKIHKMENCGDIPVIIATNLDNDEDKQTAISLGVKDYFVKSQHSPREFVEIIKSKLALNY